VVRAYAIIGPLVAHLLVLRYTRSFSILHRALASLFFLAVFFSFDGNAVWPTVALASVSLPVATALARSRIVTAGLLIGAAILFKQTAAYVLLFASVGLALERRWRAVGILLLVSSVPYWMTALVFSALDAGPEMLRWTLVVPLSIRPWIVSARPGNLDAFVLLCAFLPTAADALFERRGENEVSSRWLLLVAAGFAAICYPRFTVLQTVAAVPCLAVGTARFLRRFSTRRSLKAAAYGFVVTLVATRAAVLASGNFFDGKVLFWNHEPSLDALAARLRELPRDTPLESPLWDNVLPRSGLLPPGRLYVNPYFDWFFDVDRVHDRMQAALEREGGVVVGYRGSASGGEAIGPYLLSRVEPNRGRAAE
jgi:hypothetical protein